MRLRKYDDGLFTYDLGGETLVALGIDVGNEVVVEGGLVVVWDNDVGLEVPYLGVS